MEIRFIRFFYNKYPKPEDRLCLSQQSYDAAIYFFNIETGQEKLLWRINSRRELYVSFIEMTKMYSLSYNWLRRRKFLSFGDDVDVLEVVTQ